MIKRSCLAAFTPVAEITAALAHAAVALLKLNSVCGQASPKGREQFYMRCLFFDNNKQILGEAASGYYYDAIKDFSRYRQNA